MAKNKNENQIYVDRSRIGGEEEKNRKLQEINYARSIQNAKKAANVANSSISEEQQNLTRDDVRQSKYGYRDDWSKYLNRNYYERMKNIGKKQYEGYKEKQKLEIQSIKNSSNQLNSKNEQMAAKADMDSAKKANQTLDVNSKIPGAGDFLNSAVDGVAFVAIDKAKSRLKTWLIGAVGSCILNPITWVVVLAILFIAIIIGMFTNGTSEELNSTLTPAQINEICSSDPNFARQKNINCSISNTNTSNSTSN